MGKMKYAISTAVGSGLGYLASLYGEAVAKANYTIRPELVKADFWTAALANHGGDWLWQNYPTGMTVATMAIILAFATLYTLSKD